MKSIFDELLEKDYVEMVECRSLIRDVREKNKYLLSDEEIALLLRLEHIVHDYISVNEMKKKEHERYDI